MRGTADKVPAHIEPYVTALGVEDAIRFLLHFGGSQVFLPKDVTASQAGVVNFVGLTKARALVHMLGAGPVKVPVARKWIAQELMRKGKSANAVAQTVRTDVATVRRWKIRDRTQIDLEEWLAASK